MLSLTIAFDAQTRPVVVRALDLWERSLDMRQADRVAAPWVAAPQAAKTEAEAVTVPPMNDTPEMSQEEFEQKTVGQVKAYLPDSDPKVLPPTVDDVRQAIDKARDRIEGKDWRTRNTDGYRKWHSKINDKARAMAAEIEPGTDKPTLLKEENRKKFIARFEMLAEDGTNIVEMPF